MVNLLFAILVFIIILKTITSLSLCLDLLVFNTVLDLLEFGFLISQHLHAKKDRFSLLLNRLYLALYAWSETQTEFQDGDTLTVCLFADLNADVGLLCKDSVRMCLIVPRPFLLFHSPANIHAHTLFTQFTSSQVYSIMHTHVPPVLSSGVGWFFAHQSQVQTTQVHRDCIAT